MKELCKKIGESVNDGLIAKIDPPANAVTVTFAALEDNAEDVTVKRGTVLGRNADGTVCVYGGSAASEKFSGDASTKKFTLTGKPASVAGVKVGDTDAVIDAYNAYTGELTLHAAPAAGTNNVVVSYEAVGSAVPAYILQDDDVVVTDEADVVATAYISGCFNRAKLKAETGYTLTPEDEDELRKRGILICDVF